MRASKVLSKQSQRKEAQHFSAHSSRFEAMTHAAVALGAVAAGISTVTMCAPAYADLTPEQHYERGMQENLDSKFAEAIADYDAAIKAKPDFWKAYANRASAEYYAKDYRAALNDLNIAMPHLPALPSLTDLKTNIENAMKNGSAQSSVTRTRTSYNRINYAGGIPHTPAEQMVQLANVVMAGGHKIPANLIHPMPAGTSLIHPIGNTPATPEITTTTTTTSSSTTSQSSTTNVSGEKLPAVSGLSAKELLERGIQKANAQDWSGAITDLNECLMLEPKNGLAWAYRGSSRLGSGDLQGAVVDLDRAVDLMPNEPKIKDLRDKMKAALDQSRQNLNSVAH